jgi:hypothetical protein
MTPHPLQADDHGPLSEPTHYTRAQVDGVAYAAGDAAVQSQCQTRLNDNPWKIPDNLLANARNAFAPPSHLGIEARHPDEFIAHLLDVAPAVVTSVAKHQREGLKNPPRTVNENLALDNKRCGFGNCSALFDYRTTPINDMIDDTVGAITGLWFIRD